MFGKNKKTPSLTREKPVADGKLKKEKMKKNKPAKERRVKSNKELDLKQPLIKSRSVVYSLVAIIAAGLVYGMFFMQIPKIVPLTQPNLTGPKEEEERPEEIVEERDDSILHMNGYILGDNLYLMDKTKINESVEKGVVKYLRWNPLNFNANAEEKPEEVVEEKEETPVVPEPVSKGIRITKPSGELIAELEYSTGSLPVSKELYTVSKKYGPDTDKFHYGIDIESPNIANADVNSVLPGIVSNVGFLDDDYGHYVVVNHGTVSSLYAHLKERPLVSIGDRVLVGDKLGYVGDSGTAETPHLHFEMDVDAERFDPELFIKQINN